MNIQGSQENNSELVSDKIIKVLVVKKVEKVIAYLPKTESSFVDTIAMESAITGEVDATIPPKLTNGMSSPPLLMDTVMLRSMSAHGRSSNSMLIIGKPNRCKRSSSFDERMGSNSLSELAEKTVSPISLKERCKLPIIFGRSESLVLKNRSKSVIIKDRSKLLDTLIDGSNSPDTLEDRSKHSDTWKDKLKSSNTLKNVSESKNILKDRLKSPDILNDRCKSPNILKDRCLKYRSKSPSTLTDEHKYQNTLKDESGSKSPNTLKDEYKYQNTFKEGSRSKYLGRLKDEYKFPSTLKDENKSENILKDGSEFPSALKNESKSPATCTLEDESKSPFTLKYISKPSITLESKSKSPITLKDNYKFQNPFIGKSEVPTVLESRSNYPITLNDRSNSSINLNDHPKFLMKGRSVSPITSREISKSTFVPKDRWRSPISLKAQSKSHLPLKNQSLTFNDRYETLLLLTCEVRDDKDCLLMKVDGLIASKVSTISSKARDSEVQPLRIAELPMPVLHKAVEDTNVSETNNLPPSLTEAESNKLASWEKHDPPVLVPEVITSIVNKTKMKRRRSWYDDIISKQPKQRKNPQLQVNKEYEVEKIIDHREFDINKVQYLVKWKGFSEDFNTWEPLDTLKNYQNSLEKYYSLIRTHCRSIPNNDEFEDMENQVIQPTKESLEAMMKQLYTSNGLEYSLPNEEHLRINLHSLLNLPYHLRDPVEVAKLKQKLMVRHLHVKRMKQLMMLKKWELEMNFRSSDPVLITVENDVDLEGPPSNFTYINECIPGEGVTIPDDPPIGCECQTGCNQMSVTCCGKQSGATFAYSPLNKLILPLGEPIYECNKRCRCDLSCANRVVQRGRMVKLSVFRTATGCGWGVKAMESIKKGTFICEYVGEVIRNEEAEIRGQIYDTEQCTYLFDLDYNEYEQFPYTVDATMYGNVSHFINHSCSPNLAVYAAWINCLDPNLPKLALFAIQNIKNGKEVTFDYMQQSLKSATPVSASAKVSRTQSCLVDLEASTSTASTFENESVKMLCKCNSKKCRKYLFC